MNIFDLTPQGLKATETAMRNAMTQRLTGVRLSKFLDDAKRQLQEKEERLSALRAMLSMMDAAKFSARGAIATSYNFSRATFIQGMGTISEEDYRATLAKDLEELELLKNTVAFYEKLSNNENGYKS